MVTSATVDKNGNETLMTMDIRLALKLVLLWR